MPRIKSRAFTVLANRPSSHCRLKAGRDVECLAVRIYESSDTGVCHAHQIAIVTLTDSAPPMASIGQAIRDAGYSMTGFHTAPDSGAA